MADDNSARYRSNDPFGRGPAPAAPANDPLAELARLIGQNDPFSEYGRDTASGGAARSRRRSARRALRHQRSRAAVPQRAGAALRPRACAAYATRRRTTARARAAATAHEPRRRRHTGMTPRPRYAADYPPRAYDDQAGAQRLAGPAPPPAPSYPANDPFALPQQPPYVPQPAPHHDNTGLRPARISAASPNFGSQPYADPPAGRRDGYQPDLPGFDAPAYAASPDRQGYAPPLYPHEPEAGGMPPPHDDEFYDDEPRGGRRKGLLTVVAVLGLAVVGTAGAFGYRSMFGGPGSSGPPPVIRASGEPSKVAPPPRHADHVGEQVQLRPLRRRRQGRAGGAARGEAGRPVEGDAAAAAHRVPRRAGRESAAGEVRSPATRSAAANPPSAIGEPRRVRTVPIRPDQAGCRCAAAGASSRCRSRRRARPIAAPTQRRRAPATAPLPRAAARAASPRGRAPRRAGACAVAANAPLSLESRRQQRAAAAAAQDSFPPPPRAARAAPPARVASAPASGGGSYLVQVSSQKSEADAESAYRGIQSKYSQRARQPAAHRPPRRPRRQGRLLPRHGRAVRQPRRGGPGLQQPEAGRRRLRCAALSVRRGALP